MYTYILFDNDLLYTFVVYADADVVFGFFFFKYMIKNKNHEPVLYIVIKASFNLQLTVMRSRVN